MKLWHINIRILVKQLFNVNIKPTSGENLTD